MYYHRTLEKTISKISTQFPVILITGSRQVGKTTCLRHITKEHHYVTLDDPLLASLAQTEPKLFLEGIVL